MGVVCSAMIHYELVSSVCCQDTQRALFPALETHHQKHYFIFSPSSEHLRHSSLVPSKITNREHLHGAALRNILVLINSSRVLSAEISQVIPICSGPFIFVTSDNSLLSLSKLEPRSEIDKSAPSHSRASSCLVFPTRKDLHQDRISRRTKAGSFLLFRRFLLLQYSKNSLATLSASRSA